MNIQVEADKKQAPHLGIDSKAVRRNTAKANSIRQARRMRKHPKTWDSLDISLLIEAALDGFSVEFHGVSFDQLTDRQAKRIVGAVASHCIELGKALTPINYRVTPKGELALQKRVSDGL
jgi:hypothetical protein